MYMLVNTINATRMFMPGPASKVAVRQRLGASVKLPLPVAPSAIGISEEHLIPYPRRFASRQEVSRVAV